MSSALELESLSLSSRQELEADENARLTSQTARPLGIVFSTSVPFHRLEPRHELELEARSRELESSRNEIELESRAQARELELEASSRARARELELEASA